MAKWNVNVGLELTINYGDIEADTKEEAEQIAKEQALEDIDWNNRSVGMSGYIFGCARSK